MQAISVRESHECSTYSLMQQHIFICEYIHIYIYVYVYTYMHIHIYFYTKYVFMQVTSVRESQESSIYSLMEQHIFMYTHIYIYIHVYVYTYIYVHILT